LQKIIRHSEIDAGACVGIALLTALSAAYRPIRDVSSMTFDRGSSSTNLADTIGDWAVQTPTAIAILAPDRPPLTYSKLDRHIAEVGRVLSSMGIENNDRVALILPNGATMAVAFVAIAASATCAPLNPAYREREFEFYLADLQPKAVIIQADLDSFPLSPINSSLPLCEIPLDSSAADDRDSRSPVPLVMLPRNWELRSLN
jgi:non-ribosomal peptide synthetase component E (peptide arylation enzyme)